MANCPKICVDCRYYPCFNTTYGPSTTQLSTQLDLFESATFMSKFEVDLSKSPSFWLRLPSSRDFSVVFDRFCFGEDLENMSGSQHSCPAWTARASCGEWDRDEFQDKTTGMGKMLGKSRLNMPSMWLAMPLSTRKLTVFVSISFLMYCILLWIFTLRALFLTKT